MSTSGVQFARTRDEVTIAYRVTGQGMPMVVTPDLVSNLEIDTIPDSVTHFSEFRERLAANGRRRLAMYDGRGTGLSDRKVTDLSTTVRALDIEAVTDALGPEPIVLVGEGFGGPPALVYAATHPERVAKLVLYGTFGSPLSAQNPALAKALVDLIRASWEIGARTLMEFVHLGSDRALIDFLSMYMAQSASGEVAGGLFEEAVFHVDVRALLPKIAAPTLVLHRREDSAVPIVKGRELAALIPHAQLVTLPGNVHLPFLGDMESVLSAIDDFLEPVAAASVDEPPVTERPAGSLTILFTDLEGSTALTQKLGDDGAQEAIRAHNAIVREQLRVFGGTELKTTGDGFLATFPLASRALECAVAIERAFASDQNGLRVRIGMNAGEPVAEDDDIFGTAVQLAARIADRARGGQILVADVVRQLAAGKPFQFVDRGKPRLKGFNYRVRLYELVY